MLLININYNKRERSEHKDNFNASEASIMKKGPQNFKKRAQIFASCWQLVAKVNILLCKEHKIGSKTQNSEKWSKNRFLKKCHLPQKCEFEQLLRFSPGKPYHKRSKFVDQTYVNNSFSRPNRTRLSSNC